MKSNHLFQLSVMSAINETQKALNQRYAVTAETFDPFKSDAQDFSLKHERASKDPPTQEAPAASNTASNPSTVSRTAEISHSDPIVQSEPASIETGSIYREAPGKRIGLTSGLHASEIRRAVILSEIIGPPLSRRGR